MTTHFLYSYKDDGFDGRELRYSLRGLSKYFFDDEDDLRVTIVGDLPTWLTPGVALSHLPSAVGDSSTKVRNIFLSVLEGARFLESRGISDAIYCDDDYMLFDPVREVLPLNRGLWADYIRNRNRMWEKDIDWYVQGMNNTTRVLEQLPQTLMCYEVHRPMPFDTGRAVRLLSGFERVPADQMPFWRSTYGNIVGWPSGSYQARDVRTAGGTYPVGVPWVSTDQKYWDKIGKRLGELLPEPSRWEVDKW